MKNLILLLFLTTSFLSFAQHDHFDFPMEDQELMSLNQHRPIQNSNQATVRNISIVDSSYHFELSPDDLLDIKSYHTYNNQGGWINSLTLRLNPVNNFFEKSTKTEFILDNENVRTEATTWLFSQTTSIWTPSTKHLYTYDSNGNQTELLALNWNETTGEFENAIKYVDTFDINNLNTKYVRYIWNNEEWEPLRRRIYTYNSDGLLQEALYQDFDVATNLYEDVSRRNYTYNNDGKRSSYLVEFFDPFDLIWFNTSKLEYTYEGEYTSTITIKTWDHNNLDWVNSRKILFELDAEGNRLEIKYQDYDEISNTWMDDHKWVYFRSELSTSLNQNENSTLSCIFQNPIQAGQVISCQDLASNKAYQLSLFDVSGRLLLEKTFKREGKIQLPQELQGGIYFLNITNGGELAWKDKIVIMNN